jgi:nitrate reductase NapE component
MSNRITSSVILVLNLVLAYVAGVISIIGFFTRGSFADLGGTLAQWVAVLVGFALLVGLGNLMKVHSGRVLKRQEGWLYSLIVVVSALTVIALGLIGRGPGTGSVAWIFQYIYQPLGAAIFSLLAFFLTTALFRSLTNRARNREAMVMLVVALLVVLGQAPFAAAAPLDILVGVKDWILDYPALAGIRAIILGVGFGAIGLSIRVLLGFDRPYLE